jgi:hypothetical protein
MRMVGIASVLCAVTVSITTLFYLVYIGPGRSSGEKERETATVIETRSIIPEQYPTANDLRQDDGVAPNHSLCIDSAIKRTRFLRIYLCHFVDAGLC